MNEIKTTKTESRLPYERLGVTASVDVVTTTPLFFIPVADRWALSSPQEPYIATNDENIQFMIMMSTCNKHTLCNNVCTALSNMLNDIIMTNTNIIFDDGTMSYIKNSMDPDKAHLYGQAYDFNNPFKDRTIRYSAHSILLDTINKLSDGKIDKSIIMSSFISEIIAMVSTYVSTWGYDVINTLLTDDYVNTSKLFISLGTSYNMPTNNNESNFGYMLCCLTESLNRDIGKITEITEITTTMVFGKLLEYHAMIDNKFSNMRQLDPVLSDFS